MPEKELRLREVPGSGQQGSHWRPTQGGAVWNGGGGACADLNLPLQLLGFSEGTSEPEVSKELRLCPLRNRLGGVPT